MTTSREEFLSRVRKAVAEGNGVGQRPERQSRGTTGYQGCGPDPVQRFVDQFAAVGGKTIVVEDRHDAVKEISKLVENRQARSILLGHGPPLDTLGLSIILREPGRTVRTTDAQGHPSREELFQADFGISAVDYLIAETGSLVVTSKPHDPRSVSLLPPIHVAVAEQSQILPDLFDLFPVVPDVDTGELPSCMSLITGPSKTGDIELKLVTGVHGPKEVIVVLIKSD